MKSILDPTFKYIPAATHGDANEFAKRQAKRMQEVQQATPKAPAIPIKRKPTNKG